MENLVVGAWETSTKKIVAYATLQGIEIDRRPKLYVYHIGLYEIKQSGDVRLAAVETVKLEGNLLPFEIQDELELMNLCFWGFRIAKAKPTSLKSISRDDIGLIEFCYAMSSKPQAIPLPLTEEVSWNGIVSFGQNAGRLAHV